MTVIRERVDDLEADTRELRLRVGALEAALRTLLPPPGRTGNLFRVEDVLRTSADVFDVPLRDLRGRNRSRPAVRARGAVYLVLVGLGYSRSSAARILGRDPSTASHGTLRAADLLETDDDFRSRVDAVRLLLRDRIVKEG